MRESAECKNRNSIPSNYRIISLSNVCNSKLVQSISLKVDDKYMNLDTLIEDHEGNCRMQEP